MQIYKSSTETGGPNSNAIFAHDSIQIHRLKKNMSGCIFTLRSMQGAPTTICQTLTQHVFRPWPTLYWCQLSRIQQHRHPSRSQLALAAAAVPKAGFSFNSNLVHCPVHAPPNYQPRSTTRLLSSPRRAETEDTGTGVVSACFDSIIGSSSLSVLIVRVILPSREYLVISTVVIRFAPASFSPSCCLLVHQAEGAGSGEGSCA